MTVRVLKDRLGVTVSGGIGRYTNVILVSEELPKACKDALRGQSATTDDADLVLLISRQ